MLTAYRHRPKTSTLLVVRCVFLATRHNCRRNTGLLLPITLLFRPDLTLRILAYHHPVGSPNQNSLRGLYAIRVRLVYNLLVLGHPDSDFLPCYSTRFILRFLPVFFIFPTFPTFVIVFTRVGSYFLLTAGVPERAGIVITSKTRSYVLARLTPGPFVTKFGRIMASYLAISCLLSKSIISLRPFA